MALTPRSYPMDWLLPHARPMILIDEVVAWDGAVMKTGLTIHAGMPFFEAGKGVPAHVAIEFMAQSCGAFIGMEAMESGEKVRIGFLLGTRNFTASRSWFPEHARLTVAVSISFRDAGMGVFECAVSQGDEAVAEASLTLHQPDDAQAVLLAAGKRGA